MKKHTRLALALIFTVLPGVAFAGEAHVCKSDTVSQASGNAALSDSIVFTCGAGVSGTIPQLAKSGWQIVQVLEQADTSSLRAAMQPGKVPSNPEELMKAYWQLVIQK
ncbi:hypothetical protein KXR87_19630 [Yokenella regensburgei]|uniref:hypothetical protein n=1 Tax=Yokenella regensburgei TaxID=158877 RepID=UPI003F1800E3